MVLWDVTPCRLVDIYQHFRGTCCLYLHGSSQHIPPVGPICKIKLHHVLKDSNHTTHCHEILLPHTRKVTLILFYSCFVMPTYLRTKHKGTILRFWGKEFHAGCYTPIAVTINPLKPELNPICYLLALLGAHHFLHVSRIRVKLLNFRLLMS